MARHAKIQIVVNPISGSGSSRRVLAAFCRRLRDAGRPVSVSLTRGRGDAGRIARESCQAGDRALVVAGGDGTVSEAVGGMVGDGVPILVVPSGTENIVAKSLGMRADADWLADLLTSGEREVAFDVPTVNGRPFLIVSSMGFDAEVARRLVRRRSGHITHMSYFWPTWRTLWGYTFPAMHVEVDGEQLYNGPCLTYVGNMGRYAGGLRVLDRAVPDDGLLDVCVLRCRWQGPLLRHALNIFLRRHIGRRDVLYRQGRRVSVRADEAVPFQVDGEAAGRLPADFEMSPRRARFIVSTDWRC